MDKPSHRPFAIVALLTGLSLPASASPLFTFEKIVETGMQMPGTSYTFGGMFDVQSFSAPALDGDQLAFIGSTGGVHGFTGVYIVSGNSFDVVADTDTPIPGAGDWEGNFVYFNNNDWRISLSGGNVAFEGEGPGGIYTNIGGSLDRVADINTPMPNDPGTFGRHFNIPSISRNNIAFSGGNETQQGIYRSIGDTLQVVADLNTPRPGATGNFKAFGWSSGSNGESVYIPLSFEIYGEGTCVTG